MSQVNIDAGLVKQEGAFPEQMKSLWKCQTAALLHACEDLLVKLKLAKDGRFDYIVIRSTGISEPIPRYLDFLLYRWRWESILQILSTGYDGDDLI